MEGFFSGEEESLGWEGWSMGWDGGWNGVSHVGVLQLQVDAVIDLGNSPTRSRSRCQISEQLGMKRYGPWGGCSIILHRYSGTGIRIRCCVDSPSTQL